MDCHGKKGLEKQNILFDGIRNNEFKTIEDLEFLRDVAKKFEKKKFDKSILEKDFIKNPYKTKIEDLVKIKFKEVMKKLSGHNARDEDRTHLIGLIKDTLDDPFFVVDIKNHKNERRYYAPYIDPKDNLVHVMCVTVDKGNGKYLQTVFDADLSKMVESLKEKIIYPVRDSSTSQTQGHSLARPRGTRLTTSKTNVKHQSDKVSITQYSNKVDEFFAKTGKLLGDTEEKALGFISGGKVKRLLTVSQMTKDIGEITQDFRIGQSQIYSQASDIKKFLDNNLLPKDSQALFRALNGEEGYKLPEHLRETYTRFRTLIDKNANDLVEAGALKKENKISDYIKHYYEKHIEDGSFVEKFYFNSRFKARKSLTRDEQIALGMIEDSNFALPKTLAEQRVQLLKANTLKQVADKFGKKEIADGLVRMSDETMGGGIYKYGALAGKYVPKEVADAVKGAGLVKENMGILENYWYPIIDHIKVNVTVKNPFTHLYNVGSNVMLAFMRGDMTSFVRILNMAATDKKRFSELVKKANKYGLNSYLGEMENMDTLGIGKDPIMVTILKNAYLSKGSKTGDTARRMYDWEDKIFKLANFYNQIKKGIDEKRAFKLANEAYVDYTTPLPGAVRNLDKSGLMPFIHYSYKSTPMVLKTIAKHPFRFAMLQAAMIGTGASSWLGDNERENLYKPKWASSGFIPNVLGAKSWVDLGSGWYLNAGRLVPGMRFDGFDTLEFSGGFVGGTIKMLGGKTPLDYNIDGKYDDVPTKITKRILEMAKNYLPPLTFGRYGQRIVGKATGLYDPKNYYDEPMGYDEMLIRGAGVRHFNEKKELQSKVRAAKSTMKYKKKKSDSMLDKRKADTKFQLDLRKINSAARRKGLRLDKVR